MSVIGSNILAGASGQGGGYNLTKSLRFRRSASAYLNRTPASASNRQTWTWSGWVKRGQLGVGNVALFGASSGSASFDIVYEGQFGATADSLRVVYYDGSNLNGNLITSALYRDSSAWYHIVAVWNTTDATPANRMRLYVNGNEITAFSTSDYPTQNTSALINNTVAHTLGRYYTATSYFDGYLAEVNFIDGQALTPSSFGETSTSTGVWIPKKYTGTYGTNGFYLKFTDTTSTSTLGTDFSGNSNTWTVNNISLTAGTTYDSMTDVPTLTSATASNYCVMNPLQTRTAAPTTYSNANLRVQFSDAGIYQTAYGTFAIKSGKYYWEITVAATGTQSYIGIADINSTSNDAATVFRTYANNGNKNNGITSPAYGSSYTTNDVIGVAVDADSGTITFYKNNTSQGTAYTDIVSAMPSVGWTAYAYGYNGTDLSFNFGQQPFSYTPPTGFVALNTFNLPTPTIGATASTTANKYFNPVIWTGTGGTRSITGVGFQPDFVWAKARSQAYSNIVFDSNRGVGKSLLTDTTGAEATNEANGYISSFDTDGFSSNFSAAANYYFNQNGTTYVAWNWKANGAGVTNTNGSIISTVSANTTAGFSVVTYTGNGTSGATVGHGLGVAPSMYIVKTRSTTESWITYHISIGATNYLALNLTQASSAATAAWNNTAPTSTVFSLGNAGSTNGSGNTFVAYCFAQVAGYSAFGSYTGNGSSDGTFVYTGFRPRFVMFKRTDAVEQWAIRDTARDTYNATELELFPNLSNAEEDNNLGIDLLSNGFKIRNSANRYNASSGTYIYMAFCESPFRYANAR